MSTCGTTKTDAAGAHEITGIVDLTRGKDHPTARLSGPGAGQVWHRVQELAGRARKRLPCGGANRDAGSPSKGQQERHRLACSKDATSVPGACHIVTLAGDAPGEVRRRVQQDTTGHRGRTGDPLYQIRLLLRASRDRLTKRQQERLHEAFTADEAHISVEVAYRCAQQVRDVFHQATPAQGRRLAARLIESLPTCPIPEIARLGRTLRTWTDAFVAYFDTGGASNAPHRSHQRTLSNEADAPPEATATPPTTNSEYSSSQEASTPPPTPNSEEPNKRRSLSLSYMHRL